MRELIGFGLSSNVYYLKEQGIVHKVFRLESKYRREKNMLQDIQDIPMVIHLICANDANKTLELEYVPFVLEKLIIEKQMINKQYILKQLGEFLVMMQEKRMAHNDFKAKNILISNDMSTIKICDFDLGKRNTTDNKSDVQKFRYLVVQLVFDLDYKTAWHKFDKYSMQMQSHPILTSCDVLQIRELCIHFKF